MKNLTAKIKSIIKMKITQITMKQRQKAIKMNNRIKKLKQTFQVMHLKL